MSDLSLARFGALRDGLHASSFCPQAGDVPRIGAEAEFLVLDAATDRPMPLAGDPRGLAARLRRFGADHGWQCAEGHGAVPRFVTPGGATISCEPGGQLEVSSPPCASATALVAALHGEVNPLRDMLERDGIRLDAVGIDSMNDARDVPLQIESERYRRMTRYFEGIGPFGIRMMRQTAALQLSVDRGPAPAERWRLLNRLAPYVIALFANSSHYRGAPTGHRSYRAHCWRELDSSRTGILPESDDPATAYTRFALAATDMLRDAPDGAYQSFAETMANDAGGDEAWQEHLTTLFPEVRPHGHFEVRSCDAVDPRWFAAPVVFLYGLVYDPRAAAEAERLAGGEESLLRRAGASGLRDASIAEVARDLFQLAVDGARRLGPALVDPADVDVARAFYDTYTRHGRSPSDDRTAPARHDAAAAVRSESA